MPVSFKRDGIETSRHSVNPIGAFSCVARYRQLLVQLIRRDILGRYRGSFMGLLWSFVQPLLMLAIYTVVFGYFMKAKWRGNKQPLEFSLVLFSGLILFNFLTECLSAAPAIILSQPQLCAEDRLSAGDPPVGDRSSAALFHTALSLVAWMVMALLVDRLASLDADLSPVVACSADAHVGGALLVLSATGVFIRDVGQTVPLVVLAMMFLSPLFYSVENVPPQCSEDSDGQSADVCDRAGPRLSCGTAVRRIFAGWQFTGCRVSRWRGLGMPGFNMPVTALPTCSKSTS